MFERPLHALGIELVAAAPHPGPHLAEAHLTALSDAAGGQAVIAGGISLGAHLAVEWALANPDRCAGLMLALPAWNGSPDDAPAAVSARLSAQSVREQGLDATLAAIDSEPWLTAELTRAWRRAGSGLADSLDVAATHPAPTLAELAQIGVPTGIAACSDDPVHPIEVAEQWAAAIPGAQLCVTTLTALGQDRESLGRAAVLAWLRAGGIKR